MQKLYKVKEKLIFLPSDFRAPLNRVHIEPKFVPLIRVRSPISS